MEKIKILPRIRSARHSLYVRPATIARGYACHALSGCCRPSTELWVTKRSRNAGRRRAQLGSQHAVRPTARPSLDTASCELLGRGEMGDVYLAQHPRLPQWNALKVLSATLTEDGEFRDRFMRETPIVTTLYHPHILEIAVSR